jgi:peroxin-6
VVDDLRGEVGFVSEDIWRNVFGFIKQDPKPEQEIANGLLVAGPAMVTVDDGELRRAEV